jgi:HlyD family secretion protein
MSSSLVAESGPLARRRRRLALIASAAVVVAVLGLLSPFFIRSPQQAAADAKPPARTVLTAPVEKRVLRDTIVLRGDVTAQHSLAVTPSIAGAGQAIVTAVRVAPGGRVASGTVVLEVSGRPLIALPGAVPAYRDLKPGATGKDVKQLQAALSGLGFHANRSGTFDAATKRALSAFYASRGYSPLPVSDTDAQQVADAQRQVTAAQRQVDDARDAVAAAKADPAASKTLDRARDDLGTARGLLARVQAVTGPMLPAGEYVFLPSFPARVTASKAAVGAAVATPLVTFSSGRLILTADLTEAQHAVCRTGQKVRIAGDTGLSATGTITSIGPLSTPGGDDREGAGAAAAPAYPMVVTPSAALPESAAGQNVRLTVETSTSGTAQLVVPVSAIFAAADGGVYTIKRWPDGREERIAVRPGVSGEGYVAVTAPAGKLAPGDAVTVGAP